MFWPVRVLWLGGTHGDSLHPAGQAAPGRCQQAVDADPASITTIELALDTAHAATIASVLAALLTGSTEARGRGTMGDDVRDATGRVPILWFQDTDEHETLRQRFHIDVWVPPEVAAQRIAAAVTAGGSSSMTARRPHTL